MHTIYAKNITEVKEWIRNCGCLTNNVLFVNASQKPIASWVASEDNGILTTRFDCIKKRKAPIFIKDSAYEVLYNSVLTEATKH